jgi:DNA-binding transcriptional ArsR family regulator
MAAPDPARFERLLLALADPHRRHFVERLARGEATVSQLAEPVEIGLPAVLKHLRVLEEGGIVVSEKSGRTRTYRMRRDAFLPINDWLGQRQAEMNKAFDRLSALMAETPEERDH